MEKIVYLLGDAEPGTVPSNRQDLRDAILEMAPALEMAGATNARCAVAALDDPRASGFPQMNAYGLIDAVLSLWLASLDDRSEIDRLLRPLCARSAAYLVTESVPRDLPAAHPPPGTRLPGVALVSSFPKSPSLSDEQFYSRWHDSHTRLSLEIHPLLEYVRNSVARQLDADAPPLRAIVSESVESVEVALDPLRFYGGPDGQRRAVEDLATFAPLDQMSAVLMSEYILVADP